MDKKELRTAMKRRNLALTSAERTGFAEQIFAQIESLPAFAEARCVALFCALGDEPPTEEVLARWSRSKCLVVPRVEGERMQFYIYNVSTMVTGAFGITEPAGTLMPCDPAQIDLIVVPGTAFTTDGARMGRGRGYYDKYLSQIGFRAVKIGVCYAHQIVDELPQEPHDVGMDRVFSPRNMV
ncbi:MAG: 5-formyltetrahydrofolate cyclo-ligase [Alistipes sp.]